MVLIEELIETESRKYNRESKEIKEILTTIDSLALVTGIDENTRKRNISRINNLARGCSSPYDSMIIIRNAYKRAINLKEITTAQGIIAELNIHFKPENNCSTKPPLYLPKKYTPSDVAYLIQKIWPTE